MELSGRELWVAELEDDGYVVFDPLQQDKKDPERAVLWLFRDKILQRYYKDMVRNFLFEVDDQAIYRKVLDEYLDLQESEIRAKFNQYFANHGLTAPGLRKKVKASRKGRCNYCSRYDFGWLCLTCERCGSVVCTCGHCLCSAQEIQSGRYVQEASASKTQEVSRDVTPIRPLTNESASRAFDLIILDLDGTLLATDSLGRFRGYQNVGRSDEEFVASLKEAFHGVKRLVPQSVLYDLSASGIHLALVTRSPRAYAKALVEHFYPSVKWESVLAFEDVTRTKPDPEAYQLSAEAAGVSDPSRILVIGDRSEDVAAAYSAGYLGALLVAGWGEDWQKRGAPDRREHYEAINLLPDAVLKTFQDVRDVAFQPWKYSHSAETALDPVDKSSRGRFEVVNHFNNLLDEGPPHNMVKACVLGRYFPANSRYAARRTRHALTRALLEAKDTGEYPESIQNCLAKHVIRAAKGCALFQDHPVIVCPIPARPGRRARVEYLLSALSNQSSHSQPVEIRTDLLTFREGVKPNKDLDKVGRYLNIRDNLVLRDDKELRGRNIILVDDIVTSGATFFYARQLFLKAGAIGVDCWALAQTI